MLALSQEMKLQNIITLQSNDFLNQGKKLLPYINIQYKLIRQRYQLNVNVPFN